MQRAYDGERVHEVLTDLAALVAKTVRGEQQARCLDRAACKHEIGTGDAFDAAVGTSDQDGSDTIIPRFDTDHRTQRADRAAAGHQRRVNERDVGAALVGTRTALVAGSAVIAGWQSVPGLR